MENKYVEAANLFKLFSDSNRLIILSMLSLGELCACKILEELNITQPTLSHHMKVLCDCGLVNARRDGKWMHYSLSSGNINKVKNQLNEIIKVPQNRVYKKECSCE